MLRNCKFLVCSVFILYLLVVREIAIIVQGRVDIRDRGHVDIRGQGHVIADVDLVLGIDGEEVHHGDSLVFFNIMVLYLPQTREHSFTLFSSMLMIASVCTE